ncbi:MAG: PmoA family protein [Candidatus Hydrogenedentes bacterium]|nr:PmoA family protein [Candidatus Hydrogenedentota bacterium]
MTRIWISSLITALLVASLTQQSVAEPNTTKIKLKAGNYKLIEPILSIQCDLDLPVDKIISVIEPKTGKEFPATLRNRELVFIPEGALPNTEHLYELKISEKPVPYVPKVQIVQGEKPNTLKVIILDKLFTVYYYGPEWKKPFLWPLMSEGGVTITRDYPMDPEGTPKDHPHHKSFWTAYGDVNGVDVWTEGDGTGYQKAEEVNFGSGDAYGWILSKNKWYDKDGKYLITETREYRFYATSEKGRVFDAGITFYAEENDVQFKDTKEGGIVAARMSPEISSKGVITIATGETSEDKVWGKPSPWCDFSAELDKLGWRGLAIFDHPSNLRYPTSWHVRKYGLFGANCFGYSYFRQKDYNKNLPESGDYLIKKGDTLRFKYRMYVHSGDVEKAMVREKARAFQEPIDIKQVE